MAASKPGGKKGFSPPRFRTAIFHLEFIIKSYGHARRAKWKRDSSKSKNDLMFQDDVPLTEGETDGRNDRES